MSDFSVLVGDCRNVMKGLESDSVDSVVTDPPYELGFMGKKWDASGVAYDVELWREALRVAKPGAFLLAFGGSRTYHRLTCAIEDAGWEIRDCIMWLYGSGFPKSLDVSKAIDRAAGAKREVVGQCKRTGKDAGTYGAMAGDNVITAPSTDLARKWSGWGTALKPAHEPIVVARKPLCGTVAANFERHGCGGLNIDGCRVGTDVGGWGGGGSHLYDGGLSRESGEARPTLGRWPANVIHDGSEEATAGMGDAARYYYCAKASKRDRDEGCEGMEAVRCGLMEDDAYPIKTGSGNLRDTKRRNHHSTVKPTDLMRYLVRLVTPPNGLVLDPFTGSGSTGKACALEGFRFIGIEQSEEYAEIAKARIAACECFASLDERS